MSQKKLYHDTVMTNFKIKNKETADFFILFLQSFFLCGKISIKKLILKEKFFQQLLSFFKSLKNRHQLSITLKEFIISTELATCMYVMCAHHWSPAILSIALTLHHSFTIEERKVQRIRKTNLKCSD